MNTRQQFYHLAGRAVRAGLVTSREVNIIARPGTRKARYWRRHVDDLQSLIERRAAD
jgi:hypothetical protein